MWQYFFLSARLPVCLSVPLNIKCCVLKAKLCVESKIHSSGVPKGMGGLLTLSTITFIPDGKLLHPSRLRRDQLPSLSCGSYFACGRFLLCISIHLSLHFCTHTQGKIWGLAMVKSRAPAWCSCMYLSFCACKGTFGLGVVAKCSAETKHTELGVESGRSWTTCN